MFSRFVLFINENILNAGSPLECKITSNVKRKKVLETELVNVTIKM